PRAEDLLALLFEQRAHGPAGGPLDLRVDVHEGDAETLRDPGPDRRLPAPHEADEIDAAGAPAPRGVQRAAGVVLDASPREEAADHRRGVRAGIPDAVE